MVFKGLSDKGFVFYTNFNSKKGNELKKIKKPQCAFIGKV